MIRLCKGDILLAQTETIVIPVNCVGVMGKGLAKQFKDQQPAAYQIYRRRCKDKMLAPGGIISVGCHRPNDIGHDYMALLLATKGHWRQPSKLEWIIEGCKNLSAWIERTKLKSLAIPRIGCGHGGLRWKTVKPLVFATIGLSPCEVHIYE